MDFEDLHVGCHVKYNKNMADKMHEFPDAPVWEEEPTRCLFHIDKVGRHAVELSCSDDCGGHASLTLTKEEYQEYSSILKGSFLRISSVSDHISSGLNIDTMAGLRNEIENITIDAGPFDVDEDIENILELLKSRVQRKKSVR